MGTFYAYRIARAVPFNILHLPLTVWVIFVFCCPYCTVLFGLQGYWVLLILTSMTTSLKPDTK